MLHRLKLQRCPICRAPVPFTAVKSGGGGERFICSSCGAHLERKSPLRGAYIAIIAAVVGGVLAPVSLWLAGPLLLVLAVWLAKWALVLKVSTEGHNGQSAG